MVTTRKWDNLMRTLKFLTLLSIGILLACGGPFKKGSRSTTSSENPDPFASYQAYEHFIQGDLYEQAGNLDAAAEEYRKALIFDPGSVEIHRDLSNIYFEQKKYDEAAILRSEISEKDANDYNFIGDCLRFNKDLESSAKFYLRSLELDSTQYLPRAYVARILEILGKTKEAESQFKTLVNFAPDKLEALLDLAGFYLDTNTLDKALSVFIEAQQADSEDVRPVIGMAAIYLAQADTSQADSLYYSAAVKHWDEPQMLGSLILLFYNIRDFDKAEELAGRITELMPDAPGAEKRYALILFNNRKFARAESLLTDMEQKGQADAELYYYLARIKQENKDFPGAEGLYRKSLALADTMTDTWLNLAMVVDQQKRYQDALDIMRQAMSAVPKDSSDIIFYTSVIHANNENFDLARDGYERLLKSSPDDIRLRFQLASMDERLGKFEDAEKGFKWIIQKDPKNAMALNYLGYMYADKGIKLKESKDLIERALEIDPENGAFLDSYAWVLYKLGKYDEALAQMQKAMKTETEDAVLYDHEGDIYAALKQDARARESWQKALELKPDDDTIRAKLESK
jgi:tetratricopeptide (TPR) repeat protein